MSFGGTNIRTDKSLTVPGPLDWSGVRSPGRAARRLKQGHRQRVRATDIPDPAVYALNGMIYCHPETWKKVEAAMVAKGMKLT